MIAATCFVSIYYNVIMAWTLFYLFNGFRSELPWGVCTEDLNSDKCMVPVNGTSANTTALAANATVPPNEDYFNHVMLGYDPDIINWENFGTMQWQLVGCLLASWIIVCLALIKGVQSSGKVVYFTAIFPFVVLIILFIFGLTLDGAAEGINFYLTPNPDKLKGKKLIKSSALI